MVACDRIAMAVEESLLAPVIPDAEIADLEMIAARRAELVARAAQFFDVVAAFAQEPLYA